MNVCSYPLHGDHNSICFERKWWLNWFDPTILSLLPKFLPSKPLGIFNTKIERDFVETVSWPPQIDSCDVYLTSVSIQASPQDPKPMHACSLEIVRKSSHKIHKICSHLTGPTIHVPVVVKMPIAMQAMRERLIEARHQLPMLLKIQLHFFKRGSIPIQMQNLIHSSDLAWCFWACSLNIC